LSKSIEAIEGIGPKYGAKLRNIGCSNPAKLLADGATRKGRKKIAAAAGISEAIVLRCVNMADLFRIKGVATQYAELLEAAGVDTVKELRNRNAKNLYEALQKANASRKISFVRQLPSEKMVTDWIAQAKQLTPAVSY
jgi:predicted flap endonuclease-1-like 5' DNA nuclease